MESRPLRNEEIRRNRHPRGGYTHLSPKSFVGPSPSVIHLEMYDLRNTICLDSFASLFQSLPAYTYFGITMTDVSPQEQQKT